MSEARPMTTEHIRGQVREFVLDNFLMGGTAEDLADETSFIDTHILDSTGFLELVAYLEATFDIRIEDDEMVPENLDSLRSIEGFVSRKRGL